MKFTLSWLKEHLETNADIDEIANTLTAVGLEIESVRSPQESLKGFVTAKIISVEKHPNADRLKICKVDSGSDELQVVCGADNAKAGLVGILARPGDIIPSSNTKLKAGKIRGCISEGMMCSANELKVGTDSEGIIELEKNIVAGLPAGDVIELETVIDIALTPNRVDALGVRGVARDLAATGIGSLKKMKQYSEAPKFETDFEIANYLTTEQSYLCPHFSGLVIKGIKNTDSPDWLKRRLESIGLRPVSAVVDITQYLTIDLGRPLHAFDLSKIKGSLGPKLAKDSDKIIALDNKEYSLDSNTLLISDESGPQAIAGIIGGQSSSVVEETTDIFIESAFFNPSCVARTGRSLGIVSDARYCFERGVDPSMTIAGANLASSMIVEICGGESSNLLSVGKPPNVSRSFSFSPIQVSRLGGLNLSDEEIKDILESLGFELETKTKGEFFVTSPSWRSDVEGEQDLVEEVLRIHGYDQIPVKKLPDAPNRKGILTDEQRNIRMLRRTLASTGLSEIITWSFMEYSKAGTFLEEQKLLFLENPISEDLNVLRPSLLPNLINAIAKNLSRNFLNLAFFEVGPVFSNSSPNQELCVSGVRTGHVSKLHWDSDGRHADIFDVKGDALKALNALGLSSEGITTSKTFSGFSDSLSWYHPGQSGALCLGKNPVAYFGSIHPSVLKLFNIEVPVMCFEILFNQLPKISRKGLSSRPQFSPSPYQSVERDFSFLLDEEFPVEKVIRKVKGLNRDLISEVNLFDIYSGAKVQDNKKSIAFTVKLQPKDKTLTEEEIDLISQKIIKAVEEGFDGKLRA